MICELPECSNEAYALAILPKVPNELNEKKVELNLCKDCFKLALILIHQANIPHCELCYSYCKQEDLRSWENMYWVCPSCFKKHSNRTTTTMPWIPKIEFLKPDSTSEKSRKDQSKAKKTKSLKQTRLL